jgi:neutral ceramidase
MDRNLFYGLGRRCINPQVPVSLAGYFNIRMWEKVADDIEVRALVLKQGGKYSAIVQFDLVTASPDLLETFYRELSDLKSLTRKNMIVTATHSHTAPAVASRPGSHPDYAPFAAKKAAEALREALENMKPGELLSGMTKDNRFAFNRRYWMKNGVVVTNPGKLNPEIARPEGEVDYEIPLIGIKSEGQLKVLLANIVNHTDTIGNSEVSADWTGFFIRHVESKLGSNSMVMPLIGASGNINHFDVSTSMDQTCYAEAKRIGDGYAETVEKALASLRATVNFKMFTKNSELICGPREIPAAELADAKLTLEKYKDVPDPGADGNLTSEDLAKKAPAALKYFAKALLAMADNKEPVKFNLVGIFLGDACIVSLPSEPFVEIGLQIKKSVFPQYNTMLVSHSNGTDNPKIGFGYIPNSWNYGRGGYETTPRSNPFSVKTADMLVAAWRKMAV